MSQQYNSFVSSNIKHTGALVYMLYLTELPQSVQRLYCTKNTADHYYKYIVGKTNQ